MNENDEFYQGVQHGKALILHDLLVESDKLFYLRELFQASYATIQKASDSILKAKLKGYTEGIRHALRIMDNLGAAEKAYDNIIKPDLKIDIKTQTVQVYEYPK